MRFKLDQISRVVSLAVQKESFWPPDGCFRPLAESAA
jgi:hypothetical protein